MDYDDYDREGEELSEEEQVRPKKSKAKNRRKEPVEEEEMAKLDEKIGFMGGGMMAYAIASGMVNRGIVKPNQILASGPHPENLERWKEMGAAYTTENEDVSIHFLNLFVWLIDWEWFFEQGNIKAQVKSFKLP